MPLIKLALVVGFVALGILIAALNPDPVTLDLLAVQLDLPLGQLLLLGVLLGAWLGGMAVALSRWLESRGTSGPSAGAGGA
jgi:uncharacterized integral membrane protein